MADNARQPKVGIIVSRYNETVTRRLLDGARGCLAERGIPDDRVTIRWVSGAWELPVVAAGMLETISPDCLCALGAVIRGETPHFDFVAGAATDGLMRLQLDFARPIGFGLLTCDTLEQALARAGGSAGNKGFEAMAAALDALSAMETDADQA